MDIVEFEDKHLDTLRQWLFQRKMRSALADELPKLAYIAILGQEAIAISSLRMIEGGFALIDSLITNPLSKPELRHKAIDLIVEQLIRKAKDLKLKRVIAHTKDQGILERSQKHGFETLPDAFIILDLSGEPLKGE